VRIDPMKAREEEPKNPGNTREGDDFPYQDYSSVAKTILPIAEELHRKGESWEKIAHKLRVSKTSLYNWRKLQQIGSTKNRMIILSISILSSIIFLPGTCLAMDNEGTVIGYGWLVETELDPRGEVIATCSQSALHLWSLKGEMISVYQSPDRAFLAGLEWSPDGSMIAVADSYRRIILLRAPDLSVISYIYHQVPVDEPDCGSWHSDSLHGLSPLHIAWSPDSTKIGVAWCPVQVEIFDILSGEELDKIPEDPFPYIHGVDWSPDGRYLLVAQGGPATLYSVKTGQTEMVFEGGGAGFYSSNGSMIATIAGTRFISHNTKTGEMISQIRGGSEGTCLAWSPDGERIATGTDNGPILVWRANDGELIQNLSCTYGASTISWSGIILVAGSKNRNIHVWGTNATGGLVLFSKLGGLGSSVEKVEWFPSEKRLLVIHTRFMDSAKIYAWNKWENEWYTQLEIKPDMGSAQIRSGSLSPDGGMLAVISGTHSAQNILIIEAWLGNLVNRLETSKPLTVVEWNPVNQLLAAGHENGIDVWNTETSQLISSLNMGEAQVLCFDWSPSGDMLAIGLLEGRQSRLEIWDPFESRLLSILPTLYYLRSIAWSPDGSKIAISTGLYPEIDNDAYLPTVCSIKGLGNITLLRTRTGKGFELDILDSLIVPGHGSIAWAPNSSIIAASVLGTGTPSTEIEQCLETLHPQENTGNPILIIRAEKQLRHIGSLTGFTKKIPSISWSNDGSLIAAGSEDGTTKIWETGEIQPIPENQTTYTILLILVMLILANYIKLHNEVKVKIQRKPVNNAVWFTKGFLNWVSLGGKGRISS
jgi:WD40 repeat protein